MKIITQVNRKHVKMRYTLKLTLKDENKLIKTNQTDKTEIIGK